MRRFFNCIHLPVSHTIPSPLPPLLFFPPFLQFLNIDRISLTNIRLARSDGDFLTKSCCKIHIYIHIYTIHFLALTCGKRDEEMGGNRAFKRPRVNNARKYEAASPKRNRIFTAAAILLSVMADTGRAICKGGGILSFELRLLAVTWPVTWSARRDQQMAFKLIPPNFQLPPPFPTPEIINTADSVVLLG